MPGPLTKFPASVDPKNASVLDSPITKVMRLLAQAMASGDLQAQAMGSVNIPGGPNLPRAMPDLLNRTGPLRYDFVKPVKDRFARLLEIGGERPAEWANISRLLEAMGGKKDLLTKYNRGWGAASPGTDFVQTTREANRALAQFLKGQPITREWAKANRFTNAPSKIPNLNRAYHEGAPLSGDKAEAMAGFMTGEPRIPIDRHALDAADAVMPGGATEMKLDPIIGQLRRAIYEGEGLRRGALTDTDLYKILEEAYARGLTDVAPGTDLRRAFAQMWEGVRGVKKLPHYGGVQEVLDDMNLLEPSAMLDPKRLIGNSVAR